MKRRTPIRRSAAPKRTAPVRKVNVKRARTRRQEYAAFIRSAAWAAQRARVIARDEGRCTGFLWDWFVNASRIRCLVRDRLTVHHLRYASPLSATPDSDLVTLCEFHHALIDGWKSERRRAVKGAS